MHCCPYAVQYCPYVVQCMLSYLVLSVVLMFSSAVPMLSRIVLILSSPVLMLFHSCPYFIPGWRMGGRFNGRAGGRTDGRTSDVLICCLHVASFPGLSSVCVQYKLNTRRRKSARSSASVYYTERREQKTG